MPKLYDKVSKFLSSEKGREADFSKLKITSAAQVRLGGSYLLELADPLHREGKYLVARYKQWEASKDKNLGLVDFFDLVDREHLIQFTKESAYQCSIQNGCLKNAAGENFDSTQMTGKMQGYAAIVIDVKGNVYLREHQRGKVHHSTLVGGEPVMFAGFAKVVNGKIVDLNNFTGHYKSGKDELEFAKNRLRGCLAENAKLSIIGKSYALGYDIDKHLKSISSKLGIGKLLKFLGMSSTTVKPIELVPIRSSAQDNQEELVRFLKDYFKVIRVAIEAYKDKNTSKGNRDSGYRRILDLETRLDRAEVLLNCDDIDDQEKIQLAQFYVLSKVDDIISGKDYTLFHRKTESSLDTILGRQIKQTEMKQEMASLRAALSDDTPKSDSAATLS